MKEDLRRRKRFAPARRGATCYAMRIALGNRPRGIFSRWLLRVTRLASPHAVRVPGSRARAVALPAGLALALASFTVLPGCGSANFSFGPEIGLDGGAASDAEVPEGDAGLSGNDATVGGSDAETPLDGSALPPPDASADAAGGDGGRPTGDASMDGSFESVTTILAVHASANLWPFRICFATAGGYVLPLPAYPDDPTQPMPETNIPGVPIGGAAQLPPIPGLTGQLTPYLVSAFDVANYLSTDPNETTCDKLICATSNILPCINDKAELPPVYFPGGTASVALAVTGCLSNQTDQTESAVQCGANFTGTENLGTSLTVLSPVPPVSHGGSPDDGGSADAGATPAIAIQLVQLSPSFAAQSTLDGGASIFLVDPTIDASTPLAAGSGNYAPPALAPLSRAGATAAYVVLPGSVPPLSESLTSIQYFQSPASDPSSYFSGPTTYFAAIVGDATDAAAPASFPDGGMNPAFDGHGLHVVIYPEVGH